MLWKPLHNICSKDVSFPVLSQPLWNAQLSSWSWIFYGHSDNEPAAQPRTFHFVPIFYMAFWQKYLYWPTFSNNVCETTKNNLPFFKLTTKFSEYHEKNQTFTDSFSSCPAEKRRNYSLASFLLTWNWRPVWTLLLLKQRSDQNFPSKTLLIVPLLCPTFLYTKKILGFQMFPAPMQTGSYGIK